MPCGENDRAKSPIMAVNSQSDAFENSYPHIYRKISSATSSAWNNFSHTTLRSFFAEHLPVKDVFHAISSYTGYDKAYNIYIFRHTFVDALCKSYTTFHV